MFERLWKRSKLHWWMFIHSSANIFDDDSPDGDTIHPVCILTEWIAYILHKYFGSSLQVCESKQRESKVCLSVPKIIAAVFWDSKSLEGVRVSPRPKNYILWITSPSTVFSWFEPICLLIFRIFEEMAWWLAIWSKKRGKAWGVH